MGRPKGSTNKPKQESMDMDDEAEMVETLPAVQNQTQLPAVMTPMNMIEKAVVSGASIDVLEKLMDLQERWDAKQARRAFDEAMANAKSEIPTIIKNRAVDFTTQKGRTNYRYEDLESVSSAVGPVMSKYGLSWRYRATSNVGEPVTVTCIISHRAGHFEELTLAAGRDDSGNKNSIQAISSTMTYLQRISLKAALGLSVSNDDDGQASEERQKDTAPPRQTNQSNAAAQNNTGEARDGTPPRRTPKDDPISSGPMPQKDDGPKDGPPVPHKIPGKDHTFESWTEKYCELLKTSPDTATAMAWIDANREPLERLQKGKPSVYSLAKKTATDVIETLRDAQQKAQENAAKKTAPAGDMEEPSGYAEGAAQAPTDPETVLSRIDAELAAVEDPDQLQVVWDAAVEPLLKDLFPPDVDEAQALFQKHEKRLGGD